MGGRGEPEGAGTGSGGRRGGASAGVRRGDLLRGAGWVGLAGLLAGAFLPPPPSLPLAWDREERGDLPVPSPGVTWEGAPPATAGDWAALEEAAALGPVRLGGSRLSASLSPPALALTPPLRLRAGRVSSLEVELRAGVNGVETVVLEDPAGARDTLRLEAGPDGVARGGLALRPGTEGWQRWRVGWAGPGGAWTPWEGYALPRDPLRILALSGPPAPELAPALRALEESGEEVEAWIHLGQGVWSGRDGGLPETPEGYGERDLILLFPGIPLSPPAVGALLEMVGEGAGLLVLDGAGAGTGLLARAGLAPGWGERVTLSGQELEWELPPALSPLPPAELELRVGTLTGEGHPWIRLGSLGRGRVAAAGLAESWRWRLERGEVEAHRGWWSGWADWLSDGIGPLPLLEAEVGEARPGFPLRIRWVAESPPPQPVEVSVETEDGGLGDGPLLHPVPPGEGVGGLARGAMVPTRSGGLLLRDGEPGEVLSPVLLAIPVTGPEGPGADPGFRLAGTALGSPGGGLGEAEARGPSLWERVLRQPGWPGFLLLAALVGAGWAHHRLREEREGVGEG